jgi:hypothetical protein
MNPSGTLLMARPKGRSKSAKSASSQADRITIINLKGTEAQAEWLDTANRKTHIAKSVIVRLALSMWAEKNGLPPFPSLEDSD